MRNKLIKHGGSVLQKQRVKSSLKHRIEYKIIYIYII